MNIHKEQVRSFVPALTNKYSVNFSAESLVKIGLLPPSLFPDTESSEKKETTWLPAVNVTNNFANVRTETSDMLFTVETPTGFDALTLSITFVDNYKLELKRFFKSWMQKTVVNRKEFTVGLLKQICAQVFIKKYADGVSDWIDVDGYYVYPKGELSEDLQSDSGSPYTLQVNFVVAGIVDDVTESGSKERK